MWKASERRAKTRRLLATVAVAACTLVVAGGLLIWRPWKPTGPKVLIPASVLSQIHDFTPYNPEVLPSGLTIDKSKTTFSQGILTFQLTNPIGQKVAVTEQVSPAGMADAHYDADKVDGVDGIGYLSHDKTRTYGTLFATGKDNKPTLVLVNTTDPIPTENFKDLLRSFRAIQN